MEEVQEGDTCNIRDIICRRGVSIPGPPRPESSQLIETLSLAKLSSLWTPEGSDLQTPSFLPLRHNNRSTEHNSGIVTVLHAQSALEPRCSRKRFLENFWIFRNFPRFFRKLLLFLLLPVHVVIYPPTFRRHSPQFERFSSWPRRLWAVLSAFDILRLACVESWSRSLCRRTESLAERCRAFFCDLVLSTLVSRSSGECNRCQFYASVASCCSLCDVLWGEEERVVL